MKNYFTIIFAILILFEGKSQNGLDKSHVDFFGTLGLPRCFYLKYVGDLNIPTKPISEIYPGINFSAASMPKIKRFDYILLLENKQYFYFGDSLFSTCIVTIEIDSNGLNRAYPMIGQEYPITELFQNMAEICNRQIVTLQQAKKAAKPYWANYKCKSKESILKYNIKYDRFYWELTGYKSLVERIILIDALSGDYAETWDEPY